MKKGLILVVAGLLAFLGLFGLTLKVADAATLVDGSFTDDFESGISEESYDIVGDEGNKFALFTKENTLKISGYDYNNGYVHTKNPITVPDGKMLVVQFDLIEYASAGFLCETKAGTDDFGSVWAQDMYMETLDGNQLFGYNAGATVVGYNPAGTQTQWVASNICVAQPSVVRRVYGADGSASFMAGTSLDTATLVEYGYFTAGQLSGKLNGMVGFQGNGFAGSMTIDNFKVGYASDKTCADVTWILEDGFDTSDNWTEGVHATAVTSIGGGAKYCLADNPVSGAKIVYKNFAFTGEETLGKILTASLSIDVIESTNKVMGLAIGNTVVGIENTTDGVKLVAKNGTETLAETTTSLQATGVAEIAVTVIKTKDGYQVEASTNATSIEFVLEELTGNVGITTLNESAEANAQFKIKSLTIDTYKTVIATGRDLVTDFSEDVNRHYYLNSVAQEGTDGYVKVENGILNFQNTSDGAAFGSKYQYVNFELQFDINYQHLYEDDETGAITKASTWCGISIGRKSINQSFASGILFYQQNTTLDALNLEFDKTGTPAYGSPLRAWTTESQNFVGDNNAGKWFTIKLTAIDGVVKYYVGETGTELQLIATTLPLDTCGYVAIVTTAGGDFEIDNFSIKNLDETYEYDSELTFEAEGGIDNVEVSAAEGAIVTDGLVTYKDATEKITVTAEVMENYSVDKILVDDEEIEASIADGVITFEITLGTIDHTIEFLTTYTEPAPGPGPSDNTSTVAPTTTVIQTTTVAPTTTAGGANTTTAGGNTTEAPVKGGCKKSIVASFGIVAAIGAIAIVAKKKKENE